MAEKMRFIYLGYNSEKRAWKIGVTRNVERRAKRLKIKIEHVIPCQAETAYMYESLLHVTNRNYAQKHLDGEWYELNPDDLWIFKSIKTEACLAGHAKSMGYYHVPKIGWVSIDVPLPNESINLTAWDVQQRIRLSLRFQRFLKRGISRGEQPFNLMMIYRKKYPREDHYD